MEGEELEDMNQQQQLEFNKQYSIMQGLGYPYKQMSFNFYNNNGDPNNNNNALTNSFNQNYQIQMDQQIFGVHHNNNEMNGNENPQNQKQGEQNKKVTENSFPFEYQLQQQKQFYDQLRNSLNGGNAQNSLVLNNSMFQNLDQGIQQNFNNGNQQINSQNNNNFLKNMNNDKYGYSKFKTQGKIATEDGNKNDQNKNNEVFSCIEAVINKQYNQQKNGYKYNKMENIHQKVEENKEQHNLNRQEQLNSADKKKLVKEEEDDSQQNQINFSSSNQKGRITKSSQIYNDVDLNEENIEEKIQKIQEKLKKENELLMENDKETGKRRNQRVWNKDEDFLLKYFHKKYKGKWDLIAKEIPGRNSSQSLQRYRKFNNQKSGRSHWNQDEDRKVLQMIKQFGKNWGLISSNLKNRSGKQVRERYINCLDPSINWKEFTPEEDNKIIEFVKVNGPKWSLISRQLQGRPENMLKNRYYAHLKRLEDDKGTEGRKSKKNQKQMTKEEDKNEVMYQKMMENQNFPQQPLLAYQPNSFLQSNIVDN
ncbi:Homeodomain protein [Pseudocohnilembus persalinus]|uniref:Homeodomain protein n=1 Tax=Pseudocohnilembus persalinus TaxID=266149 RepID=A0A0V0R716_PSEPJ|nr:Homeodomain protein [Pseudocohnilembus persalinus]|eukprot:KRX10292.1 Homeodomain protein [Pseudocohnilembus persalinus]